MRTDLSFHPQMQLMTRTVAMSLNINFQLSGGGGSRCRRHRCDRGNLGRFELAVMIFEAYIAVADATNTICSGLDNFSGLARKPPDSACFWPLQPIGLVWTTLDYLPERPFGKPCSSDYTALLLHGCTDGTSLDITCREQVSRWCRTY